MLGRLVNERPKDLNNVATRCSNYFKIVHKQVCENILFGKNRKDSENIQNNRYNPS